MRFTFSKRDQTHYSHNEQYRSVQAATWDMTRCIVCTGGLNCFGQFVMIQQEGLVCVLFAKVAQMALEWVAFMCDWVFSGDYAWVTMVSVAVVGVIPSLIAFVVWAKCTDDVHREARV